jgi:multidrug efflux pump subunit AcrA (membrane-fusion protein)
MTITNLDSFTASITLAEADISSVQLGQKAVIAFDALTDLTLTGKVTSIDTTGTNSQGVVSYSVVITPDITDTSVKGGMTVSVNIITQVATDVLAVPSTAVKSQGTDGTSYVQILESGTPSNVTVETGMTTDSYTEITGGLTEGQEIIVQTVTTSDGNTTTTQRNSGGGLLDTGGGIDTGGGMPSGGPPSGGGSFTPPGQ